MLCSPRGVTVLLPGKNQAELASLPPSASPLRRRILTSWPPRGFCCRGGCCWVREPAQSLLSSFNPSYRHSVLGKKNKSSGFEEHHLKGQKVQDFKRTQDWPNLLLLSKKRPIEISEKYPTWKKTKSRRMLGELLRSTTREERLSLAWLLRAIAVLYKHLPSRAMRSVNSHVEGAENYPRLVGHKTHSSKLGVKVKEVNVCVQA